MSFSKRTGIAVYFLVLLIHCISIYTHQVELRLVSKLLLMPLLIVYFLLSNKTGRTALYSWLVIAGLVFSLLGDLFLTQSGQGYFILGMVSFIVTHICNAGNFFRIVPFRIHHPVPALSALIIFVLATFFIFNLIQAELGSLQIPILVYMGVIGVMGILATNLLVKESIRKIVIAYFLPGAVLFIVSDSMLAMNTFHFHDPAIWDIPIMGSYGIAQCLLVLGFSKVYNRN